MAATKLFLGIEDKGGYLEAFKEGLIQSRIEESANERNMNIAMRKVELKGLVMDIPDFIDMDISRLDIGDSLDCKSLTIPENVEILDDPDRTCVAIVEPSRVVEEIGKGDW